MAELQGLAFFPGLDTIRDATFTLSHGISPSVCLVKTVPQTRLIAEVGTLRFTFGDVDLRFPGAAIQRASLRINRDGQIWSLRILDRRWAWRYGVITGRYNVRRADGTIDPDSERTPQELATLLLRRMDEQRFSVARMPNKSRPAVNWDVVTPAPQLASLCDQLSCRIVLDTTNRITIYPIGTGAELPENGDEVNEGFGFGTQLRPGSLLVVGGPTRFQSKLQLEAVGVEFDGEIRKIDDLSYKPEGGWTQSNADAGGIFNNVVGTFVRDGKTTANRKLAEESVFRWYRVASQANGRLDVPGFDGKIESVDQYRIEAVQTITAPDKDGVERGVPAFVTGTFATVGKDIVENEADGTEWSHGLRVDPRRNMVIFNAPCFKLDDDGKNVEATVYLTTAYTVEQITSRTVVRHGLPIDVPGALKGVGARLLQHPEILRTIRQTYVNGIVRGRIVDNRADVDLEAKHYLDAALAEYRPEPAVEREYAGLVVIDPDGKIQQVGWRVGSGGAMTRASLNNEFSPFVPTYRERRRAERVEAAEEAAAAGQRFVEQGLRELVR